MTSHNQAGLIAKLNDHRPYSYLQETKMQPLEIKSASISHDYIDCDGHLAPRPFDTIIAKTTDGRRWMLLNGCDDGSHNVVQTYNATRLLPRVKKVGMLKPEFWLGV